MVVEEWLYAYPSGTRQVWYHRNVNDANVFYFGKFLKGKNKSIEELTRNECLFISSAYHNNHEQLSVVYEYFRNNFVFKLDTEFANPILLVDYFKDDTIRNQIVKFLSIADFGITDAKIVQMPGQEEMKPFLDELHSVINKFIGSDSALPKRDLLSRVSLGHRNLSGETVFLDFNLESRGTAALISILGPAFKALSKGKVIIVDELDTSMHSLLSRKLLELFSLAQTNTGGAQIIFTTHDTNLLLNRILRRDEIWFTEKDNEGATHIFPLTDIRTRNGDNLEKGYLQGRFGAIPFLGPINGIFDVEVEE